MKERRPLIAGLPTNADERALEKSFVFGSANAAAASEPVEASKPPLAVDNPVQPQSNRTLLPQMTSRVPVTARCRTEVASAIKVASLQRQLEGIQPYHVQGILEEALEAWLTVNGYM